MRTSGRIAAREVLLGRSAISAGSSSTCHGIAPERRLALRRRKRLLKAGVEGVMCLVDEGPKVACVSVAHVAQTAFKAPKTALITRRGRVSKACSTRIWSASTVARRSALAGL